MDGYGIIRADRFFIPDLFIDLVYGEHLSGILDEKEKNVIFNGSQLDEFSINRDFFIIIINCQTSAFIYLTGCLLVHITELGITAQLGFYSCYQLQRIKRLCNVVIRTDIEPQDLVGVF